MRWKKLGRVFIPDGSLEWAQHSALTPTPVNLSDGRIRVFVGFRDNAGVSRIGYVDVSDENPRKILGISEKPVLDIGQPGAFDDNGVILGDILPIGNNLYMYYVGFQLVAKVKFLAFTGLAISQDGGDTFQRFSQSPVLDRSDNERYIRAIHSVRFEDGKFLVWYAAGNGWTSINGKPYPQYNIHYLTSFDGLNFQGEGTLCIDVVEDEYRIGRPRVFHMGGIYRMHYTKGTIQGDYLAGYAESRDGLKWQRKDAQIGIGLSPSGWDSRSLAYPALVQAKEKTYMFFNGNDMGRTGFGCAVLEME